MIALATSLGSSPTNNLLSAHSLLYVFDNSMSVASRLFHPKEKSPLKKSGGVVAIPLSLACSRMKPSKEPLEVEADWQGAAMNWLAVGGS